MQERNKNKGKSLLMRTYLRRQILIQKKKKKEKRQICMDKEKMKNKKILQYMIVYWPILKKRSDPFGYSESARSETIGSSRSGKSCIVC